MSNNKEYTNKEILKNIIDKCDEEELEILKDIVVATFPNLNKIKEKRNQCKNLFDNVIKIVYNEYTKRVIV